MIGLRRPSNQLVTHRVFFLAVQILMRSYELMGFVRVFFNRVVFWATLKAN